jgi:hypothetical protein
LSLASGRTIESPDIDGTGRAREFKTEIARRLCLTNT